MTSIYGHLKQYLCYPPGGGLSLVAERFSVVSSCFTFSSVANEDNFQSVRSSRALMLEFTCRQHLCWAPDVEIVNITT